LESVYYLGLVETNMTGEDPVISPMHQHNSRTGKKPRNVAEAVELLSNHLPLKDKTTIANMSQTELPVIQARLAGYILNNFGLQSGNQELMKSCRSESKETFQHKDDAVTVIISALWQELQKTHKLRVVK
jgi:hypothetical protein